MLLIFSTTSTLSAGSTGSQARLIQSSHQPTTYHPVLVKDLGKQHSSPSLRTSPDCRKLSATISPEHQVRVVKSFSGGNINRDITPDKNFNGNYFYNKDCVTKVIIHKSPRKSSLKSTQSSFETSPRGSIDRDRSPKGSIDRDRSPKGSIDLDRSPKDTMKRVKSPKGSIDIDRSPKGTIKRDRSPKGSIDLDRSPKGTIKRDKSPRGSIDRDRSPKSGVDRERSPKGSIDRRDRSPKGSIDRDRSPKGSIDRDRSPKSIIIWSKTPNGGPSIQRDRSPKGSRDYGDRDRSPKGSLDRDISPKGKLTRESSLCIDQDRSPKPTRNGVNRDRSPKTNMVRDRSPKPIEKTSQKVKNLERGKSPRNSVDFSRSPQRCKSPANEMERSKSPLKPVLKKGIMRSKSPQTSTDRSPNKSPNLARKYSKSAQDRLAKLGTNSLDRASQYSPMAGYEDKAYKLGIVVSKSTESIAKVIDKPTCVQCYLSNKKQNKVS